MCDIFYHVRKNPGKWGDETVLESAAEPSKTYCNVQLLPMMDMFYTRQTTQAAGNILIC
jgi:hypothetical protein